MTHIAATGDPAPVTLEATAELVEPVDVESCLRLLAATDFGRLAFVEDGLPRLVVLNHVPDGRDLLFRTRDDSLLADLTTGGAVLPAVFEVDSAVPTLRTGWSVLATGVLRREEAPVAVRRAREHVHAWAEGVRDTVLRLEVHDVSGRRVGVV